MTDTNTRAELADELEALDRRLRSTPTQEECAHAVNDLLAFMNRAAPTILSALRGQGEGWRAIETAPRDGTPVMLFARAVNATAPVPVFGWWLPELGWVESCFAPNKPVGVEPLAWMPRPAFPTPPKEASHG